MVHEPERVGLDLDRAGLWWHVVSGFGSIVFATLSLDVHYRIIEYLNEQKVN